MYKKAQLMLFASDKNNMIKILLKSFLGLTLSIALLGCDNQPSSSDVNAEKIIHAANHSLIQIETNHGLIWVELFNDTTPKTVANFITYVNGDFYDNTIVHQVSSDFIIQAGLYDQHYQTKPTHNAISNEAAQGPKHTRGTIAMMRGNHPDSATSEFFINLKDNALFDIRNGYAVFGKVIRGMEILDKISNVATCKRGPFYEDAPCEPVIIQKVIAMS